MNTFRMDSEIGETQNSNDSVDRLLLFCFGQWLLAILELHRHLIETVALFIDDYYLKNKTISGYFVVSMACFCNSSFSA